MTATWALNHGRARGRLASIVASVMLLTGCAGSLLQSDEPKPDTYRLSSPAVAPAAGQATTTLPFAIAVARPRAAAPLDTDRIAVNAAGNRFDYYAGSRWAGSAPQMVQEQMVATLAATGQFGGGVFAAPARVPTELLLDVELRRFEVVTAAANAASAAAAPVVHVQVQASLVDSRRGVRVTSFVSEAAVPAAENRLAAVIAAFEQASAQVLGEIGTHVQAAAASLPTQ
jgi:cholesterol transport system auxiliary component